MAQCPLCYNYIAEDLEHRARGSLGTDENGDPIPFWTDDPLLTTMGIAGDQYKGLSTFRKVYIMELREYYNSLEEQLGLEPTQWTDIDSLTETQRKILIVELRIAVERILSEMGLDLAYYFSHDRWGNEVTSTQTDWTDVDRSNGYPDLPPGTVTARAIYIEELRRGIALLPSKERSYLFCETGTMFSSVNDDMVLADSSNKLQFSNLASWGSTYKGVSRGGQCLYYDRVNKVFYKFDIGAPDAIYYAYNQTVDNENAFDFKDSNWTWNLSVPIRFEPALPNHNDYEGFYDLWVTDNGDDYYLYTCEQFYQRIGREWTFGETVWDHYPNYIAEYTFPRFRVVGTSDGSANQIFNVSNAGIYVPIEEESEIVYIDGEAWTRVDNFNDSGAEDTHYTLDYITGLLQFGDGSKGKIPPTNSEISMFISLKGGGVWKFNRIVVPFQNNNVYEGVQAYFNQNKEVKLFYIVKPQTRVSAFVQPSQQVACVVKYELKQYFHNSSLASEVYTADLRFDNCSVEVSGGFEVVSHAWPGTLDKSIYLDDFGGQVSDYVYIKKAETFDLPSHCYVYSDDPSNFKVRLTRGFPLLSYIRGCFIPATIPIILSDSVTYFYYIVLRKTYLDENGDPAPSCTLTFKLAKTPLGGFFMVQAGDQTRSYLGAEWDPYKVGSYWYKNLGGGSYVKWAHSWSAGTYYEKHLEGTTNIGSVPMQFKFIKLVRKNDSYLDQGLIGDFQVTYDYKVTSFTQA